MATARSRIQAILRGLDRRLLVIVGPCSVHDVEAARDYARRLAPLREQYAAELEIVMRVYFEKPRTTVGWKGLINDPHLDGSYDINTGLRMARSLLLDLAQEGMPTATELLDPVVPQYIADLISWTAIGARTTESQTHREMASGLSMPIGYKNSTDGSATIAINARAAPRTVPSPPRTTARSGSRGSEASKPGKGSAVRPLIARTVVTPIVSSSSAQRRASFNASGLSAR